MYRQLIRLTFLVTAVLCPSISNATTYLLFLPYEHSKLQFVPTMWNRKSNSNYHWSTSNYHHTGLYTANNSLSLLTLHRKACRRSMNKCEKGTKSFTFSCISEISLVRLLLQLCLWQQITLQESTVQVLQRSVFIFYRKMWNEGVLQTSSRRAVQTLMHPTALIYHRWIEFSFTNMNANHIAGTSLYSAAGENRTSKTSAWETMSKKCWSVKNATVNAFLMWVIKTSIAFKH